MARVPKQGRAQAVPCAGAHYSAGIDDLSVGFDVSWPSSTSSKQFAAGINKESWTPYPAAQKQTSCPFSCDAPYCALQRIPARSMRPRLPNSCQVAGK